MKKIYKITAVLFLLISTFSCNSDKNSIADEQISEEQALVVFEQQINKIKTTLNNDKLLSKGESQVAATFDIRIEGNNYIIENIKYLDEFEYGFSQGFSSESKQVADLLKKSRQGGGGIKVSCEKTGDITDCPNSGGWGSDMKQARCVGKAVKSCLDGGGCAEVCKIQATIQK